MRLAPEMSPTWAGIATWTIRYDAQNLAGRLETLRALIESQPGLLEYSFVSVNATTMLALALFDSRPHALDARDCLLPAIRQALGDIVVTVDNKGGAVLAHFRGDAQAVP